MESFKVALKNTLGGFKKVLLVSLAAVAGLLLTLAGVNLIQLSQTLILYSGIALLALSVLIYFLT